MSIFDAFDKVAEACDASVSAAVNRVKEELAKHQDEDDCRTPDGDGCETCVNIVQKENSPERVSVESDDISTVAAFDTKAQLRTNEEAIDRLEATIGFPYKKNFLKDPSTNMQLLMMYGYRCIGCGGYIKSATFMFYDYRESAKCWKCQHANT